MIVSGIADEAGSDIETQIRAHKALGWNAIELRLADGKNVAGDLPERDFAPVAEKVLESGLEVTCFASAIGNWSRPITGDFALDLNELKTAIPRMQRFGARFIRTMSWVGEGVAEEAWHRETIKRYRELAKIAEDGGVYLAHENCTGWAGLGPEHTRRLIEEVGSDHLVVLFDTGNTISHSIADPWAFYEGVKDLVRYVHVKDCKRTPQEEPGYRYVYLGEGDAMVREELADLLKSGYDGVMSIEPHVASIVHRGGGQASPQQMYESYLRYGRLLMDMLQDIRSSGDATAQ